MEVIIEKNKKLIAKNVAKMIYLEVKKSPSLVLGLASGKTMNLLYKELIKKKINFSNVIIFILDEYFVKPNEKNSSRAQIEKNLFEKINLKKRNIYFLDGGKKNYEKECREYEKKIKEAGGIDLQILGIGVNGHIGFNEPGSSFNSKTRKVKLTKETRKQNSIFFKSERDVPTYALTMGLSTIMKAKKIILLAFGKEKKEAVRKALGRITEKVPASILQKHPDATFIIDRAATPN